MSLFSLEMVVAIDESLSVAHIVFWEPMDGDILGDRHMLSVSKVFLGFFPRPRRVWQCMAQKKRPMSCTLSHGLMENLVSEP